MSPSDFIAYGYGSCTAFSQMLVLVARAVGIPARQAGTPCWNSGIFKGLAVDNANVSACYAGGTGDTHGGEYLNNHNWVEVWDDVRRRWVHFNVPVQAGPDQGLCSFSEETGCDYRPTPAREHGDGPVDADADEEGCAAAYAGGGPGAAMRDHPVIAMTWSLPGADADEDSALEGGELVDARDFFLSSGEAASPLSYAAHWRSPLGDAIRDQGIRFVNRTQTYRCRPPRLTTADAANATHP